MKRFVITAFMMLFLCMSARIDAEASNLLQIKYGQIDRAEKDGMEVYVENTEPMPFFDNHVYTREIEYAETAFVPEYDPEVYVRLEYTNYRYTKHTKSKVPVAAGAIKEIFDILEDMKNVEEFRDESFMETNDLVLSGGTYNKFEVHNDDMLLLTGYNNDYYISKNNVVLQQKSPAADILHDGCVSMVTEVGDGYIGIARYAGTSREVTGYIPYNKDKLNFYAMEPEDWSGLDPYNFPEVVTMSQQRNVLINDAISHLGGRYTFGGNSYEEGVDCSSFVNLLYKDIGINIGKNTWEQLVDDTGRFITPDKAETGDLIYESKNGQEPCHVMLYLGAGLAVEANGAQKGICVSPVNWSKVYAVRTYIE